VTSVSIALLVVYTLLEGLTGSLVFSFVRTWLFKCHHLYKSASLGVEKYMF